MARQSLPVYLTPEQHRALRQLSARTGRSMSDLVRDLRTSDLLDVVAQSRKVLNVMPIRVDYRMAQARTNRR